MQAGRLHGEEGTAARELSAFQVLRSKKYSQGPRSIQLVATTLSPCRKLWF